MNNEELEELRQDMIDEARQEEYEEATLYNDRDTAFNTLVQDSEELVKINELIVELCHKVEAYGHECTIQNIIEEL